MPRSFGHKAGVEALRAKTYRSLDEAMMEALEFMLGNIAKKKLPLLSLTADAYNRFRFLTKEELKSAEKEDQR